MKIFVAKCLTQLAFLGFPILAFSQCKINSLPSLRFAGTGITLSSDSKAILTTVAEQLRANPTCHVAVTGYSVMSKMGQQTGWDRVNVVINYLVERGGIGQDRFIFIYGQPNGDPATVDLIPTEDSGPSIVPPPHPNLIKLHEKEDWQKPKPAKPVKNPKKV